MPKDTATETAGIYAALAKAQAEMGRAEKSKSNPAFRSKYADLASVQDACMPALLKHGFAVFQALGRDEHGPHLMTVLAHESGERLECPVPLIIGKNDMQGLGSAVTYARRIGLLCASGIAPEDDDGHAASKRNGDHRTEIAHEPNTGPKPQERDAEAKTRLGGAMSEEALKMAWQWVWNAYGAQPPDWAWKMKDDAKANLAKTAPADPNEPPF